MDLISVLPQQTQLIINIAVFLIAVCYALYKQFDEKKKKEMTVNEKDVNQSVHLIADELIKIRETLSDIFEIMSEEAKQQSITREVERRLTERKRGSNKPLDIQPEE
jgi:hypothetical protein